MAEERNAPKTAASGENPSRRTALIGGAAGAVAAAGLGLAGAAAATAQTPDPRRREFEGRCAFITGGARGIGLACAMEYARSGANIVIFDVAENLPHVRYPLASEADMAAAKTQIEAQGVGCLTIKGDVRDRAALSNAVAQTRQRFGRLDILVVNAGVTQVGVLEQFSEDEVQTVLDINVAGAVKTIQAAIPVMRDQGEGSIVVIASLLGRMGNEAFPVYASSKWAAIGLAKSTALVMAPHGVTCNAVCPTWVRTGLMDNEYLLNAVSPQAPTVEAVEAFAAGMSPLGKGVYEPEEVAQLVRFFSTEAAATTTGEVLDIASGGNARAAV